MLPFLRKGVVGNTVVARTLVVVNFSAFLKDDEILCFVVGISLSTPFERNFDSLVTSLIGVARVAWVDISVDAMLSRSLCEMSSMVTSSS